MKLVMKLFDHHDKLSVKHQSKISEHEQQLLII